MANVLITGASRGLGEALGRKFFENKWNVFGTATSEDGIKKICNYGGNGYQCDFRDGERSIVEAMNDIGEDVDGGLDVLINNVGIRSRKEIQDMNLSHLDDVFRVNVSGNFIVTRESLKYLNNPSRVVNINSTAGLMPAGGASGYVMSKYAMTGMNDSLRHELRDKGLLFTDVFLGGMNTDFHSSPREELMGPEGVASLIYFNTINLPEGMYVPEIMIANNSEARLP